MAPNMGALRTCAAVFVSAMFITALLTPAMKLIAHRFGAVARPSPDRWHSRPIPLLGGIAIQSGFLAAVLLFVPINEKIAWALMAGTVMAGIGVVDDFVHLRPSAKLIAQVLMACTVTFGLGQTEWLGWPATDALISILWFVTITNAFNLLDNMDGLCAGVSAIAAVAFAASVAVDQPALGAVAAALAGAASGFLLFNFRPASIFMGDSGSLFIGATLAVVTLAVRHHQTMGMLSTIMFPVVLLLIPLFDTLFVTLSRKLSARKASVGGRDHTSHRLVAMGFSESRAVLMLYSLAALGGATAIVLSRSSIREASLLTGGLLVGLCLLGVRLARVNVYSGADFAALRNKPFTPLLVDFTYKRRVFEVLLDVILASLAYYAAYIFRFGDEFPLYVVLFAQSLPIVIGCELAGLYIAGAYKGIWRYVSLPDVVTYLKGIAFGGVGSVLVLVYLSHFAGYSRGVFVVNGVLFASLVLGSRVSFRALGEMSHGYRQTGRPTLIYGAGAGGALAVRELNTNRKFDFRPVGFVDDDRSKHGRRVAGLTVIGGGDDLPALLTKSSAEVVVLSTTLDPPRVHALARACTEAGVDVLKLEVRLDPIGDSLAGIVAASRDMSLPARAEEAAEARTSVQPAWAPPSS
jgi:UDP-GlcNAc:undecaprenyl-phosphate GlcNAc-1-phosphate transferase